MELSINFILSVTIALTLNGLAALGGGLIPSPWLHRHMGTVLAVAAGVLLGSAFFELLPEALMHAGPDLVTPIMGATLAGFLVFFAIEALLGSHATGQTGHRHDHAGPLILVGDGLHNFADGLAIAAAFLADPNLGVLTTVTVIAHELPQEIADYAILIARGWTKAKALTALLLVQGTGFLGALVAVVFSHSSLNLTPHILAFSAGGFVYVAAADLLPQLKAGHGRAALGKILWVTVGAALIGLVTSTGSHHHVH